MQRSQNAGNTVTKNEKGIQNRACWFRVLRYISQSFVLLLFNLLKINGF